MAEYEIIHIETKWIVCVEKIRLISFDRKWTAKKAARAAAKLIETSGPQATRHFL
jgi:hypothetical protein